MGDYPRCRTCDHFSEGDDPTYGTCEQHDLDGPPSGILAVEGRPVFVAEDFGCVEHSDLEGDE